MRRRSRAGGEPVKTRRRKTAARKRGNAPKAVRHSSSSASGPEAEVVRLTRELVEAREQQTATGDVLKVISRSAFDLQAVLNTLVESAARLCEADTGLIRRREGDTYPVAATFGVTAQQREHFASYPTRPDRGSAFGRAILKGRIVHIPDVLADPEFDRPQLQSVGRFRAVLAVPLMREGVPIGALGLMRSEPRPFTDEQIALVQNFADQAVIAIENTRLLDELRQRTDELSHRTDDLSEALEQQTATSEVLRVISSSPRELDPVFHAVLANATRLCEANFGALLLYDGSAFRQVALHNPPPQFAMRLGEIIRPHPESGLAHVVRTKQIAHIDDIRTRQPYLQGDKAVVGIADLAGARTLLLAPMLKENELVGAIGIYRQEVRPFGDKQIALVQNFAAQAVIAIENTRLLNELRQSLEQQTATSEVLRVISSSPGELKPVFQAMLENAVRVCGAKFGILYLSEGNGFRTVAMQDVPRPYAELREREPFFVPLPEGGLGRLAITKQVVHIADYLALPPQARGRLGDLAGARTVVDVPMFKDNELVGAVCVYRQEVRPFTDKQIELLQNFAAQAVIAIENTRLLNELRELLEQQTATADVLKVISSSPGDLQPVFDAMLVSATRLCQASYGTMWLRESDGQMRVAARHGDLPEEFRDKWRVGTLFRPSPSVPTARVFNTRKPTQVVDLKEDRSYFERDTLVVAAVELAGIRSLIVVPMLKENVIVGTLNVYRREVRPFTDKQIELVQNFAAQAVIAIENTRLLNELRESLQQQTATSEVLSAISSSPSDLAPVFDTMLANATRLCDATFGLLLLYEGDWRFRVVAMSNVQPAFAELRKREPIFEVSPQTGLGRAVATKDIVHIADYAEEAIYKEQHHPAAVALGELGGARTYLVVPMLKDREIAGAIAIYRQQVRPFADKQIELVKNFASQAVIAIENTRLLNELRQSLQQQTATADVLKVISRSAFDLQTVLQTLVKSAARLCDADKATISRQKDGAFYSAEAYGFSREFMDYIKNIPIEPERGSASGRALLEGRVIHIPDVKADPEYTWVETQRRGDYRTILCVPMLREGVAIGVLILTRSEARAFTNKQIELVTTFADQAAIAIENMRLFNEIQDKSRQLEEASQHKSQFLANMSHELRTPLNAILGYTELMADGAYGEPSEKMLGILKRLEANGKHLLGLINDVLDLSKIEAGQLVLELSDYTVQDIAQTVRSTLEPLAADKKLAFKLELTTELPPGRGDGRRLTQVLINLVGNAIKFTDTGEVAHQGRSGQWIIPSISAGHRTRYFRCRSGQAVSGVPAGGQCHHPQEGRHWFGARHIEAHH